MQQQRETDYTKRLDAGLWRRLIGYMKPYHRHLLAIMATMAVNTFATNSMISIPVATALSGCLFFEQHIEMTNLISTTQATLKNAAFCREVLARHSIGPLSAEKMRSLLEKITYGEHRTAFPVVFPVIHVPAYYPRMIMIFQI